MVIQRTKWLTLAATCLGVLILNIDMFIVNVALPSMGRNLHSSLETASWTIIIYVMMVGVFPAGLGRLGDIWGQKNSILLVLCCLRWRLWLAVWPRISRGL